KVAIRLPSQAAGERTPQATTVIPNDRTGYLGEIVRNAHDYRAWADEQVRLVRDVAHLEAARALVMEPGAGGAMPAVSPLRAALARGRSRGDPRVRAAVDAWPARKAEYLADAIRYGVREKTLELPTFTRSLSGTRIDKVALPTSDEPGEVARFLLLENLPGTF